MLPIETILKAARDAPLSGVPTGLLPLVAGHLARALEPRHARLLVVAANEGEARALLDTAPYFSPELETIWLPAWDCLPYDRASPAPRAMAERLAGLAALLAPAKGPGLIVTTAAAISQRLLPQETVREASLTLQQGQEIPREKLLSLLERAGYQRSDTVADAGDYAVRGGLIDLVPPGQKNALRIDFFGDEIDGIRTVDLLSQRTTGRIKSFPLLPVSELLLDDSRIHRFRQGWLKHFGATATSDPLYQAASEGRRTTGIEHFLPLFEPGLTTLFDWLSPADLILRAEGSAAEERFAAIADYYENRRAALAADTGRKSDTGAHYRPLPPDALYLRKEELAAGYAAHETHAVHPFEAEGALDMGGAPAHDFTAARVSAAAGGPPIYKALGLALEATPKPVILASYSEGARERLAGLIADHGGPAIQPADSWRAAEALAHKGPTAIVLPLATGFRLADLELWTEQDMLGDRLVRRQKKHNAHTFLKEMESIETGELIVHQEHGIGRYQGLQSIPVAGAAHDTVMLEYLGGDKLYIPVENLDVLTRYGSQSDGVLLDKLGGAGWQQRKARLKERIREIAHHLLRTAAERATHAANAFLPDPGDYAAFVDGFPWAETDDQLAATAQVLEDLASGHPMDRLICGDVGFGKTEVALRAAYVVAAGGAQVALVCPTTILARQHAATFRERFQNTGLRIGALSRLVSAKEARATKAGLADGSIDIVVGTHALLGKTISFRRLGLVIVDEEQHFGVTHKERLKALRHDVHVLTLTATPIPRTLQMALTGIRELSVIATPPVDRLAVRTSLSPFDPVVVREALLREHNRGGQSFFVTPRIADIEKIEKYLRESVPEVRFVTAHGQMAASEIDQRMNDFYERRHDVLVATAIIESGLDIPNANTIIVHRADMFGLAELYQLRGRVGRAKRRAYALLTTRPNAHLTAAAKKRLQVLAGLDSLGAGFELASHDLDQRGAGNLLGDEQSGHIREVGFELYQSMLEEAILAVKAEERGLKPPEDPSSPTISVDVPVMIPEDYVPDLALRMALYRRIADLKDRDGIESLAAEMIDRFGKLPAALANLLKIVEARNAARRARIQKIEVGKKGALVTFAGNRFPNPAGLLQWIAARKGQAKLRPDQKLFLARNLESGAARLASALKLATLLAEIAETSPEEATEAKAPPPPRTAIPGSYRSKQRRH